jgi:hypothetical protein
VSTRYSAGLKLLQFVKGAANHTSGEPGKDEMSSLARFFKERLCQGTTTTTASGSAQRTPMAAEAGRPVDVIFA